MRYYISGIVRMSLYGQPINFTVTPSGYVGIGTSQPTKNLHVNGDVFSAGTLTTSNLSVYGSVFLDTTVQNTQPFVIMNQKQAVALAVSQTAGVNASLPVAEFYASGGAIAAQIDGSGNVGIGTSSPKTALDVVGSIACTGTLTGNASNVTGLAPSAKIDTTNADNVTSGTVAASRLPGQMLATVFAGNVGIGTSTPLSTLDVRGGGSFTPLQVPPLPLTGTTTVIPASGPLTHTTVNTSLHRHSMAQQASMYLTTIIQPHGVRILVIIPHSLLSTVTYIRS